MGGDDHGDLLCRPLVEDVCDSGIGVGRPDQISLLIVLGPATRQETMAWTPQSVEEDPSLGLAPVRKRCRVGRSARRQHPRMWTCMTIQDNLYGRSPSKRERTEPSATASNPSAIEPPRHSSALGPPSATFVQEVPPQDVDPADVHPSAMRSRSE